MTRKRPGEFSGAAVFHVSSQVSSVVLCVLCRDSFEEKSPLVGGRGASVLVIFGQD